MQVNWKRNFITSLTLAVFCLSFAAIAEDKQGQSPSGDQPHLGVQPGHEPVKPEMGNKKGKEVKNKGPVWNKESCEKQVPRLRKIGESCSKIKNEEKRKACFDKAGNQFPPGFWENCRMVIDPLKQEFEGKPGEGNHQGGDNHAGKPGEGNHQGGDNHHDKMPSKAWPKEKCASNGPKLRKLGEGCLKQKKEDKRKQCFDRIEKQLPHEFFETCREVVEPIKQEIEAKEREMYPSQKSGVDGGNEGHKDHHGSGDHHNGGDNHGHVKDMKGEQSAWSPERCQKSLPKLKPAAEVCLKNKDFSKRKSCFDMMGDKQFEPGFWENCRQGIEPIKAELMAKEKQMYPDQENAL